MYIDIQYLFWGVVGIVGIVVLVYLIIVLNNLIKLIKNINVFIEENKKSLNTFCNKLPQISHNISEISDNVKDISNVATEVTAEAIVAKESFVSNYETVKDILNIILNIFMKK